MSKELIKITTNEQGKKLVSAREIHEFLEVKTRFSLWIEQYIKENNKYGFEKDIDFTSVVATTVVNNGATRELDDYVLTLETSKEISMISGTEKGKQARKYFIECEKQLKEISNKDMLKLQLFSSNPLEVVNAHKQLVEIEVKEATKELTIKIEEDKPLVEFSNQISNSADSIEVGQFAKLVKDEKIDIGRNRLYEWLRENKYLMKDNVPYQSKIEQGLFEIKEYTYNTPYKRNCLGVKTLVTGKGQIYLVEKLRKEFC